MIEFKNVTKSYSNAPVIKKLNLIIPNGELVVLIGPSGCGKTTLLKMINRLEIPTDGTVLVDGMDISASNPVELRRQMGYVIQKTGLFPHLTVSENIEIILKMEGVPEEKRAAITKEMMSMVGMDCDEFLYRYPSQLSGGQMQRIGVARAFATDPKIILMDEPFSALDPITRTQLQLELVDLQARLKKTIVFVTHDMDEAVKIADKICILNKGEILQYDNPETVLKNPANDFVSNFVGKNRIWASPDLIKVKDIMITNPIKCVPEVPILKCMKLMRSAKVTSMLVTDIKNNMLGIMYAEDVQGQSDLSAPVSEYMKKDYPSIKPDNTLVEVMNYVHANHLTIVPVVDDNKKLSGLITTANIMTALSRQYIDKEAT